MLMRIVWSWIRNVFVTKYDVMMSFHECVLLNSAEISRLAVPAFVKIKGRCCTVHYIPTKYTS